MSLPRTLVEEANFELVYTAAWGKPEAIHMLEGRSTCQALRHASRTPALRGKRILLECDNMACVCAFNKGRCRNLPLLRLCRRNAATALAAGLYPRWRYIESKRNAADAETRPDRQAEHPLAVLEEDSFPAGDTAVWQQQLPEKIDEDRRRKASYGRRHM